MKTSSDIRDRARYLLTEELDRRVVFARKRLPGHCTHNYRHPIDVRKRVDGEPNENFNRISLPVIQQSIGLCTLGMDKPEEWNGTICEDPIDAQRCPYFTTKVSKEDIQRDFNVEVNDLDWLRVNLPEVYGLLWVLGESVKLPFWKHILFWFLRIRVESLHERPENLLPEKTE